MKHLKLSRQILAALTLSVAASFLLFYACKKEIQPKEYIAKPFSSQQASSRDAFEITTIGWLDTFQTNLALAVGNNSLTETYSFEKMAAGVEALINIATVSNKPRTAHQTNVTDFQVTVSSTSQALKGIYNGSYNAYRNYWLSTDTTETYPVALDVTILSIVENVLNVRATSILGVCNTCLLEHYTNNAECDGDAFEDGEAFYSGGGDEEFLLISSYTLPMCNWECGETPACSSPATTAYEQIEERINFNYLANNPPCYDGILVGFINVETKFAQGPPYDFLEEDCEIDQQQTIGTCMEDDLLNCAYCSFYEQIGIDPFEIPANQHFISLNIGVDYCYPCPLLPTCDKWSYPIATYTYGTPVCKNIIVYPGWLDPVYVNLSGMTL
ncbi:MAG: hypothetical protein ACKVT2_13160 [Saprospiraceae bacterium]